MNVYDLIKAGVDRNKLVYDFQAPNKQITLSLLNLMVFQMPSINIFIFSNSGDTKYNILEIFQEKCFDLNDYLPDRLSEYKILGREIQFIDGLSIDFGNERGKYIEYFEDALKCRLRGRDGGLVLGINSNNKDCLLGCY